MLVSNGGYYITISLCWVETLSVLVSNGGYYITLSVLVSNGGYYITLSDPVGE